MPELEAAHKKVHCRRSRRGVRQAGGLFIIGTERHESRRIDNQLRGRAGRQGDPGDSRFFISLGGRPDAAVRRRAACRTMMDAPEVLTKTCPSRTRCISGTIENAQKKLEGRNFCHPQKRAAVRRRDEQPARDHLRPARQGTATARMYHENIHTMIRRVHCGAMPSCILAGEVARRLESRRPAQTTTAAGWPRTDDFRYTPEALGELEAGGRCEGPDGPGRRHLRGQGKTLRLAI